MSSANRLTPEHLKQTIPEDFQSIRPELETLIDQYSDAVTQVIQIEQRFSQNPSSQVYRAQDIDIINTARQYYEALYDVLLEAANQSVPASPQTDSSTDQTVERQFQSLYVLTQSPSDPDTSTVLSASDLEKQIFSKPVTETAFFQSVEQLIASWLIFAITGRSTIFALAPLTFITGIPTISTTTIENDTEYLRIFFHTPSPNHSSTRPTPLSFANQLQNLAQIIDAHSPHLQIRPLKAPGKTRAGQFWEVRMRKKEVLKGSNYDETKGRMPLANHTITLPLNQHVVVQTGFRSVPDQWTTPRFLTTLLTRLQTKETKHLNQLISEGLELISNDELYLPPHLVKQAQGHFRSMIRTELKNLHYEVHLWFHFFLRALLSEQPLAPFQKQRLFELLDSDQTPTFTQITKLLYHDLFLLSHQQKTVMKKMEQFSELLETYDRTSVLGQRQTINLKKRIQQAAHSFPQTMISTRYVPQTITATITVEAPSEPEVVAFGLFPELVHYFICMNAAKHNPLQADIEIQISIDQVKHNGRSCARVAAFNKGKQAAETVHKQLFNTSVQKIISLSSTGSGTSLKTALALTCLQNSIPLEQAHEVFGITTITDQPELKGFGIWYLLPLSSRYQAQTDNSGYTTSLPFGIVK